MKKLLPILLFSFAAIAFHSPSFAKTEPIEEESVDNSVVIDRISNEDIQVFISSPVFTFRDATVTLKFRSENHTKLLLNKGVIDFIINGEDKRLTFVNGETSFPHRFDKDKTLSIYTEDFSYSNAVTAYPLWAILVPFLLILIWIISRMVKKKKE